MLSGSDRVSTDLGGIARCFRIYHPRKVTFSTGGHLTPFLYLCLFQTLFIVYVSKIRDRLLYLGRSSQAFHAFLKEGGLKDSLSYQVRSVKKCISLFAGC